MVADQKRAHIFSWPRPQISDSLRGDGDPRQAGHAGGILGLADASVHSRRKAKPRGRKARQRRVPGPIATKKSRRWIRAVEPLVEILTAKREGKTGTRAP